jgi:hypothetical protein
MNMVDRDSGLDLPARCRSTLPGTIPRIRLRMPTAELYPRTRHQSKLAHLRDRLNGTEAAQSQLLISTMATTPGLTKLPGVLEEKDGVM